MKLVNRKTVIYTALGFLVIQGIHMTAINVNNGLNAAAIALVHNRNLIANAQVIKEVPVVKEVDHDKVVKDAAAATQATIEDAVKK